MLRKHSLAECTLGILKRLHAIPLLSDLRLVGGTALALQLGHRKSIDLDFFGKIDADAMQIADTLKAAELGEIIAVSESKSIKVFFVNKIKVDFVNYPYEWINPPVIDEGVIMADLPDIAAMKLNAIAGRGRKKDFIDTYFLLQHLSLREMVELYKQKYGTSLMFSLLRSLTYFTDAEEDEMPEMLIPANWADIKDAICTEIRKI